MLILRGAPALSEFRIRQLMDQSRRLALPVTEIYAEFIHFAELSADLTTAQQHTLEQLLTYGPALASHEPEGLMLLVTPRPGTISPWSSKATDIAHNCGLQMVTRLERGTAYYVKTSATLTIAEQAQLAALLHDRMMEAVF